MRILKPYTQFFGSVPLHAGFFWTLLILPAAGGEGDDNKQSLLHEL
jgi:hypothetical protein